jgi:hypothetical protein
MQPLLFCKFAPGRTKHTGNDGLSGAVGKALVRRHTVARGKNPAPALGDG